jgi:hypothetical protein
MQGYKVVEISQQLGCTESKVYRILRLVRELYRYNRHPDRAEEAFKDTLKLRDELARQHALDTSFQRELAQANQELGSLYFYHFRGHLPQAESRFQEALRIREQLVAAARRSGPSGTAGRNLVPAGLFGYLSIAPAKGKVQFVEFYRHP